MVVVVVVEDDDMLECNVGFLSLHVLFSMIDGHVLFKKWRGGFQLIK